MRNEERDVYVIPPNFIEGGTLLGGMFKTRNVIEAGVLGLLVGLPVLNLGISLTTRVIILCLTALPLVLVALIGISGSSLSAFILQFFRFLRNRRVLNREPPTDSGEQKKSILPSWLRKKQTEQEAQEQETMPVSRSSLRFDRKERKVTQHKTFLPPEEKVTPLNLLADYVPIEKIENGVIYTRDHRYVKVVEVVPVNFLLRSAQERYHLFLYQLSENCPGQGTVQGADEARGYRPPYGDGTEGVGAGNRPTLPDAAGGLPAADPAAWLP